MNIGTKPRPSYFVERDRLQSALILGLIVVETDVEGGTMHPAGFALKQKRRLACLVHPPKFASPEKARGNQKLIKESGAFPLEKKEDLKKSPQACKAYFHDYHRLLINTA